MFHIIETSVFCVNTWSIGDMSVPRNIAFALALSIGEPIRQPGRLMSATQLYQADSRRANYTNLCYARKERRENLQVATIAQYERAPNVQLLACEKNIHLALTAYGAGYHGPPYNLPLASATHLPETNITRIAHTLEPLRQQPDANVFTAYEPRTVLTPNFHQQPVDSTQHAHHAGRGTYRSHSYSQVRPSERNACIVMAQHVQAMAQKRQKKLTFKHEKSHRNSALEPKYYYTGTQ